MLFRRRSLALLPESDTLPGRSAVMPVAERHTVLGTPLKGLPEGAEEVFFGMGCFWGAERKLWQQPGVVSTSVGYQGGHTPNPTYKEVCTGRTNHTEVVRVVFDPTRTSLEALLSVFWENHDPTQGMRQGGDVGTQYRSAIYTTSEAQRSLAERSREAYQQRLTAARMGEITTEILPAKPYYFAEDYHQQYLHKNPQGYCGLGGTGVSCPVGVFGDAV